jgi:hypothetical protein
MLDSKLQGLFFQRESPKRRRKGVSLVSAAKGVRLTTDTLVIQGEHATPIMQEVFLVTTRRREGDISPSNTPLQATLSRYESSEAPPFGIDTRELLTLTVEPRADVRAYLIR